MTWLPDRPDEFRMQPGRGPAKLGRVQSDHVRPFLDIDWQQRSHREVQEMLRSLGWSRFAQGDWAYAYASPSGDLVARVAPFDPGYQFFIELCRKCHRNAYLPEIRLACQLEGGGHLTLMERLTDADPATTAMFEYLWQHPDEADQELRLLRSEVDAFDRWGRRHHKRWWVGVDIGHRHILVSATGKPKIIDLFGLGTPMLEDLISDPVEFSRSIKPDQCRYLLDMPDLQDLSHSIDYRQGIERALSIARSVST